MASAFNPTLSRRKRFLPEYRQLFEALLNIPDVDVQDRVAQAVNNMQKCSVCKNKISLTKDIATQTGDTLKPTSETDQLQFAENKEPGVDNSDQVPAKRRRKRKRACPKVVKKAQHSNINPILRQENTSPKKIDTDESAVIEIRSDDEAVQNFITNDLMDFENPEPSIEDVRNQMKLELLTFYNYDNGYLPIHDAIATNEVNKLKRQLYVMKFRKEELLSLYTEFNDNPIQLAIKKNCIIDIFNELLTEVTDLNDCDDDECNTIIHLAVIYLKHYDQNEQTSILKIFESLLQKVDMKILLKRNNDGLTALQIAVNEDKFLMVEKIFDVLDKRLNLKPLTGKHTDKQSLKNHYDVACNDLEDRQINEMKSKILNATSMKCGRTALYFAIERQYDHLIYLLMAHKSNPTIKNFSGQDAKTYYAEYGKNPTIAGVLDRLAAMFS